MIMARDSNNNYVKIEDIITQQNNFNGISPIKFKSSGENLENYRIYGNTVGGESVGDRTTNLFDENSESIPGYLNDGGAIATVPNYPISTYDYINVLPNTNYSYKAFIDAGPNNSTHKTIRVSYYTNSKVFISRHFEIDKGLTRKTITTPNNCFYVRLSIDDNLRNVMLWRGSSDVSVYEPYGYRVPVMVSNGTDTQIVPIYLPEQIRKVDDEAEYIDFEEQKQHFADGTSVDVTLPALPTLSGTNTLSVETNTKPSKVWGKLSDLRDILYVKDNLGNILFSKYHEIEGEPPLTYKAKKVGTLINYCIYGQTENGESVGDLIETGEHAGEYLVPVIVTNGTDTQTINIYLPEQIKIVGNETEYIDFREQKQYFADGTSVDVTLPALPTLSGTNTLSVGTVVQPSKIKIKEKIKGKIYGWHVNPDISDSSNAVTYLEDAIGMTPASMGSTTFNYGSWENAFFMPKPCMLKSNGKVDYYLDPNDYTKKLNGTASDISNPNYDGNAMM